MNFIKQARVFCIILARIFICWTICFNSLSPLFASTFLEQGIFEFEQGKLSDAKTSFKIVLRNRSKTHEHLTAESYLFALEKEFKFPCGNNKLITHILSQAKKNSNDSCGFYKVLMAKLSLLSSNLSSTQRARALLYLRKKSIQYPYAGYIFGQYFEKAGHSNLETAQEAYFQTANSFEESKKKVLDIRKKKIKTYINALDKNLDSVDMKKVCIDLNLGITSQYVDYDIAIFFNFLLSTDSASNIGRICYYCLSYLAQRGLYTAEAFCYIFRKLVPNVSRSLDLSLIESIKTNLMLKVQVNDPLYLASYALHKLHSLHAVYLSQAELCKIREALIKLKKLEFAPALYELHRLKSIQKNNCNSKTNNGNKLAAVLGDSTAQYALAIDYLIESKDNAALIKKGLYWLRASAKRAHVSAQLRLGEIYYEGKYTKKNIDRSLFWFKKAVEQGSTKATYLLGKIYGQENQPFFSPDLSLKYLKQAADSFYPPAINSMGELYLKGRYVPKDYQLAFEYFVMGSEWQYLDSIYNLAWMIQRGRGTQKDDIVATSIFKHGAELEDPRAQHHLAWRYLLGIGVSKNITEAMGWMRKAADNGYAKSCYQLGKIYYWGDEEVAQNLSLSLHYFKLAAQKGCNSAQYYLGDAYKKGVGVEQSDSKAVYWFLKAAKNGHIKASYEIGLLYVWSIGVPQNLHKAFLWLKKAAEANYFPAISQLGKMYFLGLGTDENIEKALHWYSKAAYLGDLDSGVVLAWICFHSITLIDQGVSYAKLASNNNHPSGLFLLSAVNIHLTPTSSNRTNLLKRDAINNPTNFAARHSDLLKALQCNYAFAINFPTHFIQGTLKRRELKGKFIRASRQYLRLIGGK